MLHPQVPLVNIGVLGLCGPQVVSIPVTPLRQFAVCLVLRTGYATMKWIGQGSRTGVEVIVREKHGRALTERRTRILEVGGDAHSVIDACAPAKYGVLGQLVSKAKPGSPVVAVGGHGAPMKSVGEERCSDQLFLSQPKG